MIVEMTIFFIMWESIFCIHILTKQVINHKIIVMCQFYIIIKRL